jgi:hypothetical protein
VSSPRTSRTVAANARRHRAKPALKHLLRGAAAAIGLVITGPAAAQSAEETVTREAVFEWDPDQRLLFMNIGFRDVVDAQIQSKLSRGLPTTIVLTATLFREGSTEPVATTAQTCRVTWHVWEEAYRVEITRPGSSQVRWTTTAEGVLRRCAEARRLLAGDRSQLAPGTPIYAAGKIQVNPISAEVLQKIKRWVMRPASTGTAAPGDALFSTFTGLFLQRIGDAERELKFSTRPAVPSIIKREQK